MLIEPIDAAAVHVFIDDPDPQPGASKVYAYSFAHCSVLLGIG
jgi:hypothetical protein